MKNNQKKIMESFAFTIKEKLDCMNSDWWFLFEYFAQLGLKESDWKLYRVRRCLENLQKELVWDFEEMFPCLDKKDIEKVFRCNAGEDDCEDRILEWRREKSPRIVGETPHNVTMAFRKWCIYKGIDIFSPSKVQFNIRNIGYSIENGVFYAKDWGVTL